MKFKKSEIGQTLVNIGSLVLLAILMFILSRYGSDIHYIENGKEKVFNAYMTEQGIYYDFVDVKVIFDDLSREEQNEVIGILKRLDSTYLKKVNSITFTSKDLFQKSKDGIVDLGGFTTGGNDVIVDIANDTLRKIQEDLCHEIGHTFVTNDPDADKYSADYDSLSDSHKIVYALGNLQFCIARHGGDVVE